MRVYNDAFVTSQSIATTYTSQAFNLTSYWGYAFGVVITGSPVGQLKLQASVDATTTGIPTMWVDISSTIVAISSAMSTLYNQTDVLYNYVRLVYTATSGTGTISATIQAKGT